MSSVWILKTSSERSPGLESWRVAVAVKWFQWWSMSPPLTWTPPLCVATQSDGSRSIPRDEVHRLMKVATAQPQIGYRGDRPGSDPVQPGRGEQAQPGPRKH